MIKFILIITVAFLSSLEARTQDLDKLVSGFKDDLSIIGIKYSESFIESSLFALSKNWSTSSRVLPKYGIQLNLKTNAVLVKSSMKTFNFSNGNVIRSADNNSMVGSTIIGGKRLQNLGLWIDDYEVSFVIQTGEEVTEQVEGYFLPDISLKLPEGYLGVGDIIAIPFLQLNLGTGFNTEVSFRYNSNTITPIKTPFLLYGAAIKARLDNYIFNQYLHGDEPLVYVSILVGYNKVTASNDISLIDSDELLLKSKNIVYNFEIEISKEIHKKFDLSFDLGYSVSKSYEELLGSYTINNFNVSEEATAILSKYYNVLVVDDKYLVEDLLSFNLKYRDIYGSIGIAYRFGSFTSNLGYSKGLKYQSINIGLSMSFY